MTTLVRLAVLSALVSLTLTWSVGAQTLGSVLGLLATVDLSTLVPVTDPALTDPAASEAATTDPPHLPKGGVYFLFATTDLAAFDLDGNLRWYRSLVTDYPDISNQVGMAASPVLWKDFLIVPMDTVGDSSW